MSSLALVTGASTHVGKRSHNEDSLLVLPTHQLLVVADGVGGRDAGEVASRLTVETLEQHVVDEQSLASAIRTANDVVRGQSSSHQGMGSTVVAARFQGQRVHLAWVGDSRAYRFDGDLHLLTRDHSVTERLIQQGQLTDEEEASHPDRHTIWQAIGLSDPAQLQVEESVGDLTAGDILLLCSDGLSDVVDNRSLCQILSSEHSLPEKAELLVRAAVEGGGSDNITVVLGCLEGQGDDVERPFTPLWTYHVDDNRLERAQRVVQRRKVAPRKSTDATTSNDNQTQFGAMPPAATPVVPEPRSAKAAWLKGLLLVALLGLGVVMAYFFEIGVLARDIIGAL